MSLGSMAHHRLLRVDTQGGAVPTSGHPGSGNSLKAGKAFA